MYKIFYWNYALLWKLKFCTLLTYVRYTYILHTVATIRLKNNLIILIPARVLYPACCGNAPVPFTHIPFACLLYPPSCPGSVQVSLGAVPAHIRALSTSCRVKSLLGHSGQPGRRAGSHSSGTTSPNPLAGSNSTALGHSGQPETQAGRFSVVP